MSLAKEAGRFGKKIVDTGGELAEEVGRRSTEAIADVVADRSKALVDKAKAHSGKVKPVAGAALALYGGSKVVGAVGKYKQRQREKARDKTMEDISKSLAQLAKQRQQPSAEKAAGYDFFSSRVRFAKNPSLLKLQGLGRDLAMNTPGTGIVQGRGAGSLFETVKEGW